MTSPRTRSTSRPWTRRARLQAARRGAHAAPQLFRARLSTAPGTPPGAPTAAPPRTPSRTRLRAPLVAAVLALAAALILPGAAAQAAPRPTAATLAAASQAVLDADVAGTAWVIDPAAGTVRVAVDRTVTPAEVADLVAHAGPTAGSLTIERVPGTLRPRLQAGEAIYADAGWRCTAGLNVSSGGEAHLLTAGHCTDELPTWYTDQAGTTLIGPSVETSFPGNDYGLVRYDNPDLPHPSTVTCDGTDVPITEVADAAVGESVTFSGSVSGCHSGTVTGLNATVNYGGGDIVSGLIETDVCAEPGDSGGLLFADGQAIGLLSGGSGNCVTGGTSYFQPVSEAMDAYGLTLP